jgi:hypothetical protein
LRSRSGDNIYKDYSTMGLIIQEGGVVCDDPYNNKSYSSFVGIDNQNNLVMYDNASYVYRNNADVRKFL